jgi:hypothetical protein
MGNDEPAERALSVAERDDDIAEDAHFRRGRRELVVAGAGVIDDARPGLRRRVGEAFERTRMSVVLSGRDGRSRLQADGGVPYEAKVSVAFVLDEDGQAVELEHFEQRVANRVEERTVEALRARGDEPYGRVEDVTLDRRSRRKRQVFVSLLESHPAPRRAILRAPL